MAVNDTVLATFLLKRAYTVNGNGCHVWQGCRDWNGYGKFFFQYKSYMAHRLAWQVANGAPIPNGMYVMHTCDNPPCINPEHLVLGTAADNSRDMVQKGRSTLGRRLAHRKYDPDNPSAEEQHALEGRAYTENAAKKLHVKQYAREYMRHRRATDPTYREKQDVAMRRWRDRNPERKRELNRASMQRKRDVLEPGWREKRYERIVQQRERQAKQEERERLRAIGYSMQEIADLAGVNRSTVFRWIESGLLGPIQTDVSHGGRRRDTRVMPDVLFPFLAGWHKHKHAKTNGATISRHLS